MVLVIRAIEPRCTLTLIRPDHSSPFDASFSNYHFVHLLASSWTLRLSKLSTFFPVAFLQVDRGSHVSLNLHLLKEGELTAMEAPGHY